MKEVRKKSIFRSGGEASTALCWTRELAMQKPVVGLEGVVVGQQEAR